MIMIDKNKRLQRLEAARQVILGNLFIEEAMMLCQIHDKRTMVTWIKRALQQSVATDEGLAQSVTLDAENEVEERSSAHFESQEAADEQLRSLMKKNRDLVRYQNLLSNRINELEILIEHAEKKFKIKIKRIK